MNKQTDKSNKAKQKSNKQNSVQYKLFVLLFPSLSLWREGEGTETDLQNAIGQLPQIKFIISPLALGFLDLNGLGIPRFQRACLLILLIYSARIKGCGMGPWLVLVSPCFRENVVATYKIGSFLCSLDNLLQKNVIGFFFWKSNFKMALTWKKGYFWPTFHIF